MFYMRNYAEQDSCLNTVSQEIKIKFRVPVDSNLKMLIRDVQILIEQSTIILEKKTFYQLVPLEQRNAKKRVSSFRSGFPKRQKISMQ